MQKSLLTTGPLNKSILQREKRPFFLYSAVTLVPLLLKQ